MGLRGFDAGIDQFADIRDKPGRSPRAQHAVADLQIDDIV
jgi:hypothetical protein